MYYIVRVTVRKYLYARTIDIQRNVYVCERQRISQTKALQKSHTNVGASTDSGVSGGYMKYPLRCVSTIRCLLKCNH